MRPYNHCPVKPLFATRADEINDIYSAWDKLSVNQFTWSPGIGDPTIGGWITVALYLVATVSCWKTSRRIAMGTSERRVWFVLALLFLCLGLNKQLDLQSALTEIGRVLATHQHWYGQRQTVQVTFIIGVATAGISALLILLFWVRRSPLATLLAVAGTAMVIAYVLVRAASFHHIDRFIGQTVLGFRWNWIIEMSGIGVVIFASWLRAATLTPLNIASMEKEAG